MFNIDRLIDEYSNSFYDYKKSFLQSMKDKEFVFLFSYPTPSQIQSLIGKIYKESIRGEWKNFTFLHDAQSNHINKIPCIIRYKILWMGFCMDEGFFKKESGSFYESIEINKNHSQKKFSNFIEYFQYLIFPILYGLFFPLAKVQVSLEIDEKKLLSMHTTDFIIPHYLVQNLAFPHSPYTPKNFGEDHMREFINTYHSKENDIYKGLSFPKTHPVEIKDNQVGNLFISFMMSLSLIPVVLIAITALYTQGILDKRDRLRREKEIEKLTKEADADRFLRIYD